jgi:hypothetical protein
MNKLANDQNAIIVSNSKKSEFKDVGMNANIIKATMGIEQSKVFVIFIIFPFLNLVK